jgi:pimeloyl-ACP methyl ester carboxylesterase
MRRDFGRAYGRGVNPAGNARQLAAIQTSGNRSAALRRVTAPTLVIHGTKDRLVGPSGGKATAKAIPDARLLLVEGMGHDLPRGAWPQIIEAIADNAARAGAPAGAPA